MVGPPLSNGLQLAESPRTAGWQIQPGAGYAVTFQDDRIGLLLISLCGRVGVSCLERRQEKRARMRIRALVLLAAVVKWRR